MKQHKMLVREFLAGYTEAFRKAQGLTQDKMAEALHITSRAYRDLEHGKYCFSAITLLFLLLTLDDERQKLLLEGFRERVRELEHKEAA